jgi:ribosomal protein S27AE
MSCFLDEEEIRELEEALALHSKIKAVMIREGRTTYQTECPRCSNRVIAQLHGLRNHLHLICEGRCGISIIE